MFVFKPSEPRPLFSQKAVCSGTVTRAVFAPREEMLESCEESSQWLNRSQLYFLTQYMVNNTNTEQLKREEVGCDLVSRRLLEQNVFTAKETASGKRVNPVELNINKLNVDIQFGVHSLSERHRYYPVLLVTIYFSERTYCADADVDSPLQDLMTFTTKTEEERLMASSKQVQHTQYSDAFTDHAVSS